jgi:hypothetical protein
MTQRTREAIMSVQWRSLLFLVILAAAAATYAFGQTALPTQDQQAMRYSVVYSDGNGVTHFRDERLAWQATLGSRGQQNFVTSYVSAQKIGFLRISQGGRSESSWHPAPSKRFVMVLSGLAEVEVGDGERRTFGPGNVLLVTDTEGRGHLTNVIGNEDVFLVWVPVP